jgi:muconolactone delta-isomerase
MTATTPRPELVAIARVLGVEVGELHGLDGVSDDDLSVLHGQIATRLSADKRRRFARVAALSQSIPGPIAGRLAEKFLPPAGGALVAELLEPAKARDLVGRVSVGYLGDLAIALDPVRAQEVVRAIPAARVGEVAQELFTRGEYAAMARFVGAVEVDALFATLGVATPHDLLAVVPLLTWNDNLDRVIAELPDHQIQQIAADLDAGELAELALALDPHRFGPIVAAVPVATVADIASALLERGEHAAMAGFAGVITPEMLSAAVDQATDGHLAGVVSAVASGEMWAEFDHLVEGLDDQGRGRLITVLGAVPSDAFSRLQVMGGANRLGAEAATLLDAAAALR